MIIPTTINTSPPPPGVPIATQEVTPELFQQLPYTSAASNSEIDEQKEDDDENVQLMLRVLDESSLTDR